MWVKESLFHLSNFLRLKNALEKWEIQWQYEQ